MKNPPKKFEKIGKKIRKILQQKTHLDKVRNPRKEGGRKRKEKEEMKKNQKHFGKIRKIRINIHQKDTLILIHL